ncbi:MAG: glutamine--fructose-6-phosphate transaminase (isomerizing) [Candidatus Geothermincolia bacterium]
MCGIVGYAGEGATVDILMGGLRRLEYRGYDSAGIAICNGGSMDMIKARGNLDELEKILSGLSGGGPVGIAHTRWATHGRPSRENAHPHLDCTGRIAVVHNGIIENYRELRDELHLRGHAFRSETDSEVLAHLLEESYQGDLARAAMSALRRVRGAFALVCMTTDEPGVMVGARWESPLVLGIGDGEMFLGSAIPAFLKSTQKALFLENGDVVRVTAGGYQLMDLAGEELTRSVVEIPYDIEAAEKGGYPDFMLKEIFEQPEAWSNTLAAARDAAGALALPELNLDADTLAGIRRVIFVACGTAYHAGLIGRYIVEHWMRIPVEIDIASEFRYREPKLGPETLVVAVSQSGETADTLAALRGARAQGARVVCIVNTVGSLMTRESDGVLYTHAGPEIGVAATKTFLAQIAGVYLLGLYLGQACGVLEPDFVKETLNFLDDMPQLIKQVLAGAPDIEKCAAVYAASEDLLFLGRNINYPVAMEGALKLKEISYIHAEGYPAGEMKHGPIALLHSGFPCVALAPRDSVYEKMVSNLEEMKARGAPIVAVGTEGDSELDEVCDHVLRVPRTEALFYPVLVTPVLQLFAYYIAKQRGCNVDQPRNLAKTVTVE